MAAYYYIAALANPIDVDIGRPLPEKAEPEIPDRQPDFPQLINIPFAEERRLEIFPRLFSEWSYALQNPILVRTNDDGTVDAWLHPEGLEPKD